VISVEVGLPLMRVNVASLVDMYIGETEKNLARVFAQAQAHGGILLFDEADALFGARTNVSRAQDRYANLETNLLLQLMESFSGIVFLTTNLKNNIDPAFMRRIMYKVYFEPPEPVQRAALWRRHVPEVLWGEHINFDRLGTAFELTGGSIRSAALRAAYRCSALGRGISTLDLVECAKLETANLGRVAAWK
jgi:SpoVK/Ycf46/Vps4 family AAA+-type ATPase